MIENKVKRGDVVALARTRSTTYKNGPTRRHTVYTLARVNGTARDGEATSLVVAGGAVLELRRKHYRLEDVRTISGPRQHQAQLTFKALTWDACEFDSVDELKAAILAA